MLDSSMMRLCYDVLPRSRPWQLFLSAACLHVLGLLTAVAAAVSQDACHKLMRCKSRAAEVMTHVYACERVYAV